MLQSVLRRLQLSANVVKLAVDGVSHSNVKVARTISLSSTSRLKHVEQVTEGNVTKIEGKIVESERAPYLVKHEDHTGCTLCKIHPHLKYTQKRLEVLVNKAQRAGLLPQFRPALRNGKPRTSHRSNYKWKRYNVYFKE